MVEKGSKNLWFSLLKKATCHYMKDELQEEVLNQMLTQIKKTPIKNALF